jgi:hypothetical protein
VSTSSIRPRGRCHSIRPRTLRTSVWRFAWTIGRSRCAPNWSETCSGFRRRFSDTSESI